MQDNNQTNDTGNATPDVDVVPANTIDTTTPAVDTPPVTAFESTATEPAASEVVHTQPAVAPDAPVSAPALSAGVKKQILIQYGIATAVILIIGVGLLYALEQQGRVNTGVFDKVSALVNPAPAAAIVNGTKISKADYDKNLAQLQTAAEAQGADVNDASIQTEIKKQAIDVLVNTELLRQAAYAEGAMVTDDQINARYEEIKSSIGGEEQLAAKMTELGITEPALRKDIEGEILIQGHLSKAVDTSKITVSEKEMTDAYAQISSTAAAGVTIPPLEEIKTQLEAQLKTNKEQELVNAYITKLREGASIEVLI